MTGAARRFAPDVHRDAMLLLGLLVGLAYAAGLFATPVDAVNYWGAGPSLMLYPPSWSEVGEGFLFYPPPVAQISALLQPVGWAVFIVVLMVTIFGSFWYCCREWSLPLVAAAIPFYLGVGPDWPATFLSYALIGNLQWVLAAVSILAIRHPALWAFLFFTKVTTAVGWLWHVARGEYGAAAMGAFASAVVLAISFVASPYMWADFISFAVRNAALQDSPIPMFPVPYVVRVPMSAALIVWGGRTDRAWTVPAGVGWALPAMYGLGFLPFWVAALRMARSPTPLGGDSPAHPA